MRFLLKSASLAWALTGFSNPAFALIVDDFSNAPGYSLLGNARNGCDGSGTSCTGAEAAYSVGRQLTPTSSTVAGPIIMGAAEGDTNYDAWAFRTSYLSSMYYYGNDAANSQFGTTYKSSEGTYIGYLTNTDARSTLTLTWDGTTRSFGTNPDPNTVNTAGLSPAVDLSESGTASSIRISLLLDSASNTYFKAGTVFTFDAWSNGGSKYGSSSFTAISDNSTTDFLEFAFSSFGTAVDFGSVSALRLSINSVQNGTIIMSSIETFGQVSEPATAVLFAAGLIGLLQGSRQRARV
jgi:hypothetical protein